MSTPSRKTALVTGGGTGVGRATILHLAARGFDVVINYSRSKDEAEATAQDAEKLGVRALIAECHVASDEQVRRMVATCQQQFGRLDVLVNNAATTRFIPLDDLDAVTDDVWDEILGVNVKGAFYVSRAAMPLLRATKGSIVNVASVAGLGGSGSSLPYAASKGALITMTKSFAKAFAPDVRVNAVCPGVIESRWLKDHPEMIESAIPVTPLQRASTPDDIADAIVFLACDARMMTGQAVVVDGGRTM